MVEFAGFMYVRFTQPPTDLFDWYEEYLQDEEEIDIKAGGGQVGSDQNHSHSAIRYSDDALIVFFSDN